MGAGIFLIISGPFSPIFAARQKSSYFGLEARHLGVPQLTFFLCIGTGRRRYELRLFMFLVVKVLKETRNTPRSTQNETKGPEFGRKDLEKISKDQNSSKSQAFCNGCSFFCLQLEASCLQWSFFTYN